MSSAPLTHPHEILPPPSTLENVWNGTVEVACAVAEAVKNGLIQLGTWISIGWEHAVVWFKDAGAWLSANVITPTSHVIADFFSMIWAGLVKVYNVVTPYLVGFVNWSQGKLLNGWHSFTQLVKQNPVATIAVISAFVLGALAGALIRGCCASEAAPAQDARPSAVPAAAAPVPNVAAAAPVPNVAAMVATIEAAAQAATARSPALRPAAAPAVAPVAQPAAVPAAVPPAQPAGGVPAADVPAVNAQVPAADGPAPALEPAAAVNA